MLLPKKEIEFLGHCIENQSISISDDKTKAVTKFPLPTNQKQLQLFSQIHPDLFDHRQTFDRSYEA